MTKDQWLEWLGSHEELVHLPLALGLILLAVLGYWVAKRLLLRVVAFVVKKTNTAWDDVLLDQGVFNRLAWLAPAIVVYYAAYLLGEEIEKITQRLIVAYVLFIFLLVGGRVLTAANEIYNAARKDNDPPIKSYLQIVKLIGYMMGGIAILAIVLDRSPWGLLSGIGAMTAIILLIFKDTILSFVASIQLASNDMLRLGDWIEMPQFGADGDVIDIALHTVKVQNWDKTITTIPTHKLIDHAFKNWRGMTNAGGRRIKRSVNIDQRSIRFLDEALSKKLSKLHHISAYLTEKAQEVASYNEEQKIDSTEPGNGRRLTNIGTFRAYLVNHLQTLPQRHKDMTFLVRQLQGGPEGLPIEIYMFSNDTAWANFEAFQADIFDHVLAVLPTFDLRVFQNPTGHDFETRLGG